MFFSNMSLSDVRVICTLGVGGFSHVELVRRVVRCFCRGLEVYWQHVFILILYRYSWRTITAVPLPWRSWKSVTSWTRVSRATSCLRDASWWRPTVLLLSGLYNSVPVDNLVTWFDWFNVQCKSNLKVKTYISYEPIFNTF